MWPLLLLFAFVGCSSQPTIESSSNEELCHAGDGRACVRVYKNMAQSGPTPESERFLHDICELPRLSCFQLAPTEPVASVTNSGDELLFTQDVWVAGVLVRKQVILYKSVAVAPSVMPLKLRK